MDQNSENIQQPEDDEVPPGEPYFDVIVTLEDGTCRRMLPIPAPEKQPSDYNTF